jgi:hypothetical protein
VLAILIGLAEFLMIAFQVSETGRLRCVGQRASWQFANCGQPESRYAGRDHESLVPMQGEKETAVEMRG